MGNAFGKTIRGQQEKLSNMSSYSSLFLFGLVVIWMIFLIIMAVTVSKNPELIKMGMESMAMAKGKR